MQLYINKLDDWICLIIGLPKYHKENGCQNKSALDIIVKTALCNVNKFLNEVGFKSHNSATQPHFLSKLLYTHETALCKTIIQKSII